MLAKGLIALLRFMTRRKDGTGFPAREARTILVVELTRLGDVVVMLPAIETLCRRFKEAQICVLVDEQYAPLVKAMKCNLEVYGVKDSFTPRGVWHAVRTARRIRADLACSMSPARRNVVVTLASSSRQKAGYLTHLDSLTPFRHISHVQGIGPSQENHLSYGKDNIGLRPMKLLQALGCEETTLVDAVAFRDELIGGREAPGRTEFISSGRYIAVHPFSGWVYRTWPPDRFAALIQKVVAEFGCKVVIVCSKREEDLLNPLRRQLRGIERVIFHPSSSILETARILREAMLFVGNDSGPLHLAAALGTRVVGVFGPAPPSLTAPSGSIGTYLYHLVECSPCDQRRCIRPQSPCIGLITVDEVFSAISQQLAGVHSERAPANG